MSFRARPRADEESVPTLDPARWHLDVHGLVERPLRLTLRELHHLRSETLVATLECAGNGRSTFSPPIPGEQWRLGAVMSPSRVSRAISLSMDKPGGEP